MTRRRRTASTSGPRKWHVAPLSDREALLFEAGIKLGGVFHQYLGTPVSRTTATGLARTIEAALGLQPYVQEARVRIQPSRGGRTGSGAFAYHYLTAEMLEARVRLRQGSTEVTAELAHRADLRYPLMRVVSVAARKARSPRRRAAQSGRSSMAT